MQTLTVVMRLVLCCLLTGFCLTAHAAGEWQITKVQMISNTQGWALAATPRGSVVLKTIDGGREWHNVSPKSLWPLSPAQVQADLDVGAEGIDFYFLNGRVGWVALKNNQDQVIVERTRDGGRHWAKSHFTDHVGYFLTVSFLDNRYGWVLTISDMASGSTHKELYRTKDGGETWTAVTDALPDHIDPMNVTFRTATEGWLSAGYHGSDLLPFYRTQDAGRHWQLQELDSSALIPDDEGYGITYPPCFFGAGRCDGLLTVQWRVTNTQHDSEGLAFFRTRDAGHTWLLVRRLPSSAIPSAIWEDWNTLTFRTPETGWILKNTGQQIPQLLLTHDSGKHWRTVYPTQRRNTN